MFRTLAAMLGLGGGRAAAQTQKPLAAPAPLPLVGGFAPERLARIDELLKSKIATGQIAGSVYLLARKGKVAALKAQGLRDLATGDPMRTDAIFRIRSQTKPVTGVAMMMLYEQGLWRLDDPVTLHVPEFAGLQVARAADAPDGDVEPIKRPPTMRELMTHTAGFAYGLAGDSTADRAYLEKAVLDSASLQDMVGKIAAAPMYAQPGQLWRYSIATDIQGYIIEKLSGMSLPDFMRTRIFEPLRMTDTGFFVPPEKRGRLATLYDADPTTGKLVEPVTPRFRDVTIAPDAPSGGGGLVSTARDYGRFCQMILNGGVLDGVRVLKASSVALMAQNHLPESFSVTSNGIRPFPFGPGTGFGLDFAVAVDPAASGAPVGKGTLSWGGSAGTWFWIDPVNELYFVGMIQRQGGVGSGLDAETRVLVNQALMDRPPPRPATAQGHATTSRPSPKA